MGHLLRKKRVALALFVRIKSVDQEQLRTSHCLLLFQRAAQPPGGPAQRVLRLVEVSHRLQIIQTSPGQVLLGLDCFQDDAHRKFLPLLRQAQTFCRGGERTLHRVELIGQ